MSRFNRYLGAVSAFALIAGTASPAFAAGTAANTSITNTATVSFNVGGVAQTAVSDSDTFVVDRKINVTVTATGTSPTVSANTQNVVRQFTVTNTSNAAAGFALTTNQATTHGLTLSNVRIYVDANNDGIAQAGELTSSLLSLAPDAVANVLVLFDVPASATNNQTADIRLIANAYEPVTTGSLTTEIVASTAADSPTVVDTVLADLAGPAGDAANAGDHSAQHTVTVQAAAVTVNKVSRVVTGPPGALTSLYAVPGAVVEYCIAVSNATGAATATNVTVSDNLTPAAGALPVTLAPNVFGTAGDIAINGTSINTTTNECAGGTDTDKSYTTATRLISETLEDIPAGATRTLRFRVTIN